MNHSTELGLFPASDTAVHVVAKLPDHDLWLASFRDSEDNLLALMSDVSPGA